MAIIDGHYFFTLRNPFLGSRKNLKVHTAHLGIDPEHSYFKPSALTTTPACLLLIPTPFLFYLMFLFLSGNNLKVLIALVRYPSPTLKLQTLSYNHYTTVAFADAFSFFILPDLFLPLWKQLSSVHVICRKRSLPLKNLQHSALTTTLP